MRLIAHRGNTNGPSPLENEPLYVLQAMEQGYDVEIDVWVVNGEFALGHDYPQYGVSSDFFKPGMWCHAKNFAALTHLQILGIETYFWHDTDKFTLTSSGHIWTYPGGPLGISSIAVMPEVVGSLDKVSTYVYGVCSDYVSLLK